MKDDNTLTPEQTAACSDLVTQVLQESAWTRAQVIDMLESLLADPELSTATLVSRLNEHHAILRKRIAEEAFRLGLQLGQQAPQNE